MSNLGRYSPFNRSFQFMHLQNSAYHLKNKQNAKPLVKTNLKRSSQSHSKSKSKTAIEHRYSVSQINHTENIRLSSRHLLGEFESPKKVIHRDEVVVRAQSARITRDNFKMVNRLIKTGCMVTDKTRAESFYNSQKKYRNLRRKYQESGERITTPIVNIKLMNPTLASFWQSRNHSKIDRINDDSF